MQKSESDLSCCKDYIVFDQRTGSFPLWWVTQSESRDKTAGGDALYLSGGKIDDDYAYWTGILSASQIAVAQDTVSAVLDESDRVYIAVSRYEMPNDGLPDDVSFYLSKENINLITTNGRALNCISWLGEILDLFAFRGARCRLEDQLLEEATKGNSTIAFVSSVFRQEKFATVPRFLLEEVGSEWLYANTGDDGYDLALVGPTGRLSTLTDGLMTSARAHDVVVYNARLDNLDEGPWAGSNEWQEVPRSWNRVI